MKAISTLFLLTMLLVACSPAASPTPAVPASPVQLRTPTVPPGAVFFDGCTHMVSYPSQLTTSDGILFNAPDEASVSVLIVARRRTDDERALSLDALAARVASQWGISQTASAFEPLAVVDYHGHTLDGLQAEGGSDEGQHVRLMVVVRPQTLLGDMLPDDVVYQVVAQAPETVWAEWSPVFDVVFQNFYPKDCGGV